MQELRGLSASRRTRWAETAALAALTVAAPAMAQDRADPIVVTGSTVPVPESQIGNAITVIDAAELEARGDAYLLDTLRTVPGLAAGTSGSFGSLSQLRIRGGDGNHVLVLVDGVEVAPPGTGEFDFGTLLAGQIERVEVLRGPQSGLYGSNAMGGVVSIVTRGAAGDRLNASLEAGSYDTFALGGGATLGDAGQFVSLSGAFRRSDGFSSAAIGTEDDGNRNLTLYARGSSELSPDIRLSGSVRHVDAHAETDGFDFSGGPLQGLAIDDDSYSDTTSWSGGLALDAQPLDGWSNRVSASYSRDNLEGGTGDTGSFGSLGTRWKIAGRSSLQFGTGDVSHLATIFTDHERETYRDRFPFDPSQEAKQVRELTGLGAEYRLALADRLFARGAVRHDWNDAFADATTFSIAGAFEATSATRLHASFGTGVTNPTFVEQFGFIPGSFVGNPDLKPERLRGWDVGVTQALGDAARVDVTYFRNRLEDEIVTIFPSVENQTGTSKAQGIELAGTATLGAVDVSASYTWLDATDPDGQVEIRRPEHAASVTATGRFGPATVHAGLLYNGEREDTDFRDYYPSFLPGRATLDNYVSARLAGSYRISSRLELTGRVENLFDSDYQEALSYAVPGLSVYGGLRLALD